MTVVCEISLIGGLHTSSLHLWSKLHAEDSALIYFGYTGLNRDNLAIRKRISQTFLGASVLQKSVAN